MNHHRRDQARRRAAGPSCIHRRSSPLPERTRQSGRVPILFRIDRADSLLSRRSGIFRNHRCSAAVAPGMELASEARQESLIMSGLPYALLGTFLIAINHLLLKQAPAVDPAETLVSWNLVIAVPLSAIPASQVWATATTTEWALLAIQGALGALSLVLATFMTAHTAKGGKVDHHCFFGFRNAESGMNTVLHNLRCCRDTPQDRLCRTGLMPIEWRT